MPWTIGADGKPEFVEDVPDRVAPAPAPAGDGSTIIPELEQRAPGAPAERTVQLVDPTGSVYDVAESGVASALESGRYELASPEQIDRWDTRQEREGAVAQLKAFGHAAGRAAWGAASFVPELIGKGLVALGANEGTERPKDALELEAIAEQRRLAEDNPGATFLGSVAGSLPGGVALGGTVGGIARGLGATEAGVSAIAGGAEGALQGYSGASEEAYFENRELTAEQMIASMGWGALIGGTVGYGTGKVSERLFSRSGSRGATPFDPVHGNALARDTDVEAIAGRVIGEKPVPGFGEKFRDAVADTYATAASAASGAERETIEKFGVANWSEGAKRGRDLYRRAPEILEGATRDITKQVDDLARSSRKVLDEVTDVALKRENIATKLTGDADTMAAAARAEASRLREAAATIAENSEQYGNRALGRRIQKFVDGLATQAESGEAAGAFIALDRAKRGLQGWTKALRSSARSSTDALKRQQAFALGDELDRLQEGTRTLLMSEKVWGKAGADQRAINAAWERFFESDKMYRQSFLTSLGRNFDGSEIMTADPAKVSRYVRGLGKQEGSLVDQQFRAHVAAVRDLSERIGNAFDLGAKGADLDTVRAAAAKIDDTLGKADETVRVVNQIDAVIQAEKSSGFGTLGAIAGSAVGGPIGGTIGAGLGLAADMVVRPGQGIRQLAAIEAMGRKVSKEVDRGIDGFFERQLGSALKKLPANENAARALPPAGGLRGSAAAAIATPLALFMGKERDKQEAYRKRAREILDANAEYGTRVRARVEETFAAVSPQAPKLAASVATKATKGAQFLASKLPAPIVNAQSLTPSRPRPVSDVELEKFARYWSAVSSPVSVLEDLQRGKLAPEQVEALQAVYPEFYQSLRLKVVERLGALDSKGTLVPYRARLQLDLLLNLNGAGEPTASAQRVQLFQGLRAEEPAPGEAERPTPPARPINIASRLRSGRDALEPGAQQ